MTRRCSECGVEIVGRRDRQTCSPRCRVARSRRLTARCEEAVDGRTCKRRATYRIDSPGMPVRSVCGQHAEMVVTWDSTGKVYVFDL